MEKRQNELVAKLTDAKIVAVKQQASKKEPNKSLEEHGWARSRSSLWDVREYTNSFGVIMLT